MEHGVLEMWESKKQMPPETNMAIEDPPFEDVFPIEHEEFPLPS